MARIRRALARVPRGSRAAPLPSVVSAWLGRFDGRAVLPVRSLCGGDFPQVSFGYASNGSAWGAVWCVQTTQTRTKLKSTIEKGPGGYASGGIGANYQPHTTNIATAATPMISVAAQPSQVMERGAVNLPIRL